MTTVIDLSAKGMTGFALVAYPLVGSLVGLIYFRALWSDAQRLVSGGGIMATFVSSLCRFGLVGSALVLASREGAAALLLATTGILAARQVVMARVKVDER